MKRNIRSFVLVTGCCSCLLALASPSTAISQDPSQTPPVFRAGTRVVPVDVRVVDKNGQPVTDLTQADFTVFEDGIRQELSLFTHENLPISMAIVST